jgi:hypothetical protein
MTMPIRGEKAELTSPGWLRGLAWLTDTRILVGSSPATLFEIDLVQRKVIGEMKLEDDVAWTTHGIYADERKCCEDFVDDKETRRPVAENPKEAVPARGIRKLFKGLGF